MNKIQKELFKLLLTKKNKEELIDLHNTVDYEIYRELIKEYWLEHVSTLEEFNNEIMK
jgi:hypothetical protein